MAQLQFVGALCGAPLSYATGIQDLQIVEIGGLCYLVSSSGSDGGMMSFALTSGNLPALVSQRYLPGDGVTPMRVDLAVVETAAGSVLLAATCGAGASSAVTASGKLGGPASVTALDGARALAVLETGAGTFIYAARQDAPGIALLTPGSDGQVTAIPGGSNDGGRGTAGMSGLALCTLSGERFLLAASETDNSVTAFRIDAATGALTRTGSIGAAEGLGIDTPTALAVAETADGSFAIVASAGSSSLSVLRLTAGGSFEVTDHVIDTLGTRFQGVTALEVVPVGERVYVIAGGADDGLALFTLLPDGTLLFLQGIADDAAMTLDNLSALAVADIGGELQLFTAGQGEAGITQFRLSTGTPGLVLRAAAAGAQLTGGGGDDLLAGGAGNDSLSGGGGADILLDGAGSDRLMGGSGADIFVLSADAMPDMITDFTPGADRIDLSHWHMLYGTDQLGFVPTSYGAMITYRDELLDLYSASGKSLTLAQVFPSGFLGPDRPPLFLGFSDPVAATAGDDQITGTPYGDELSGLAGRDTILGLDGSDVLRGDDGDDSLDGGAGEDTLCGGAGTDTLRGGAGDDRVWGDNGRDSVMLGPGNDLFTDNDQNDAWGADSVWGWTGNDTILGAGGADVLRGEDGEDSIEGGAGDDLLYGGYGYDTLRGGDGNDRIWGGDGRDLVFMGNGDDLFTDGEQAGDKGRDTVHGGPGNDTILARGADDLCHGEDGDDSIEGGADHDLLYGGAGSDTIRAGTGNDSVWGDDGRDLVLLGEGDDLFADTAQGGPDGADTIWGWTGNDTILGGGGDDLIHGEDGADLLFGGAGSDRLDGGAGVDMLAGGSADDLLFGGSEADQFVFAAGDGRDRIVDFEDGVDQIVFDIAGLSFAALTVSATGTDTVVDYGTGQIVFEEVALASIDAGDFLFL